MQATQIQRKYIFTGVLFLLSLLIYRCICLFLVLLIIVALSWRRRWHPTPVLLPGKSHGRRSLVGCSPWGCEESERLSDFPFTFHFHALEKEMTTHSSVLAWRIPGTREPGGLPSMGSHRIGHDWSNLAAAAAAAAAALSCFKSDMQVFLHYYLPKSSVSIEYEIGYMGVLYTWEI